MQAGHLMSAAATAPAVCEEQLAVRRERRPCARPGGVTIGQLLARAHEALQAGAAASCPMCGGAMERHGLQGQCNDCGTQLA
jgi:hypothetical protein